MNRDEQKLRDAFGRKLGEMQPSTSIDSIHRGARRARVVTALATVLIVSVAGVGGYALTRPTTAHDGQVVGPGPGSIDGQIAFSRFGDEGGIYTMEADGSNVEQLIAGDGYAIDDPAWAPDGTKIAFHGFFKPAQDEAGGLFVMNADGSEPRLVEQAGDAPSWSPDGQRIVFYSGKDGSLRVVTIDETGSEVVVEQDDGRIDTPDWSPDGKAVVFGGVQIDIWNLEDGSRRVFARRGDLTSVTLLLDPAWSPDGSQIAYTEVADTAEESPNRTTIKIADVSNGSTLSLTKGSNPTWSPDGTRIAFERTEDTFTSHIYSINVDGTDERQLTFGEIADHSPDWGRSGSSKPEEGAMGEASRDDADRQDQLTWHQGRVACHDGTGDLLGEGSGDQSGPGPQPPDEDHPGTDLTGFSMGRHASGLLEMNYGTKGEIPRSLEPEAQLHFVLAATPRGRGTAVAAIRASLKNDRWTVWARSDDDDSEIPVTPEIADNVLNLIVDAQFVPHLMRGDFKWSAHSEWIPQPTESASETYADYCPDSGFPLFEGTAS